MRKVLLFTLLLFVLNCIAQVSQTEREATNHYILATGSKGGNYNKTGVYIVDKYNNTFQDNFIAIESNGSNENIELLKNNYADFAIIQRNVLLKNLYDESQGINNIEVIAPLFEEKFLFYLRADKPTTIEVLKNRIQIDTLQIGFTSKEGYSYHLYEFVFKYLGINKKKINEHFGDYEYLKKEFLANRLDGIISFSLPIKELEDEKLIQHIYFNASEIRLLENRIPNLFKTNLSKNNSHYSLGSWAFLVGLKNKISQIDDSDQLFNRLYEKDTSKIHQHLASSISLFVNNGKTWNKKFLKGIPINDALAKKIHYSQFNYERLLYLLALGLLIVVFIYLLHKRNLLPDFSYIFFWHRYKHIVIGILTLSGLYFLSVVFLTISEQNFYNNVGIKSQLLNFSKDDLHFWLLIRNLTGIDNGISPLSTSGKLILSFYSYLLWIGTLLIAFSEYLVYQISKKRKQGLMNITLENHIVIVGWNDTTNNFIKDTLEAAKDYNGHKERIVCIVPAPDLVLEKHKKIKELHSEHKLFFVKGEIRDKTVLERANIHKAKTVVLLAEDNSRKSDERTLLRALAIARFCRRKVLDKEQQIVSEAQYETFDVGHYIDAIYIIAEINDFEFKKDLMEADVNEVIVSASYAKGVITQSILNHGVSKVVDELLQFNDYNEFYTVDLIKPENSHLVNRTYDELLMPLRKQKILLIGIKVVYHDEKTKKEIIDETELTRLLVTEGLGRQVIVNPITPKEIARKTDRDDQLVVFATNRKDLKKELKAVVFE